jgi:hypothetical protein
MPATCLWKAPAMNGTIMVFKKRKYVRWNIHFMTVKIV